ncbi:unnamed protein product [Somion occarium]|uniref:ARID domain-containing protein n=1 Tax=Somion occarium TaxID=3059160 RepID=A0ABP1CMY9_9APHY
MLPSVPPQTPQPSLFQSQNGSSDPSMPFSLDPYTAKQMAALQATSLAKVGNRSAPGGTSAGYFGGMSINNPNRSDPAMGQEMNATAFATMPSVSFPAQSQPPNPQPPSNPAAMQQNQLQRKRQFLSGLASILNQRNPLPPQLTGVPYPPGYDPTNSPWRSVEVSPTEIGNIRLAGKDVDLFKLWALVLNVGGGQKATRDGLWPQIVRHLDLPEQLMHPSGHQQSITQTLQNVYNMMIGPFEEAYRKNMVREQQQRAAMMARAQSSGMPMLGQGRPDGMPAFPPPMNALQRTGSNPNLSLGGVGMPMAGPSSQPDTLNNVGTGQFPPRADPMASAGLSGTAAFPNFPGSVSATGSDFDSQDPDGRKRKMRESEEADSKRARQKTNGSDGADLRSSVGPSSAPAQTTVKQPSRRRIEYVPLRRELETFGGRDLKLIEHEFNVAAQRPRKPNDEWGSIDVEALTLSLRSRISTELSYGLTTFSMLTVFRGSHNGFPIAQAPDLLEEMLDLIEDVAFNGEEDTDADFSEDSPIITNLQLVTSLVDDGSHPFANLKTRQGWKDRSVGPGHRPGDIILAAMNVLRNLSIPVENHEFLAKHPRFLGVLLRLCGLKPWSPGGLPAAVCSVLSLPDIIAVRKDTVYVMLNISAGVRLMQSSGSPSIQSKRIARRAFSLLASYFVDEDEAAGPFQCVLAVGLPLLPNVPPPPPPVLMSTALECFARICQPDDTRKLMSQVIPQGWLWTTFEALVHRLPLSDNDYAVLRHESWLAYMERLMLAMYSLSFLSPPETKKRIKTDTRLRFHKVILRFIRKLLVDPASRQWFMIVVRRAIETTKLIDDCEDSFDTSHASMPTLAFGMGWGEHGETRLETGDGLFSGYQEDITWQIMTLGDLDPLMFSDLASLVRVG